MEAWRAQPGPAQEACPRKVTFARKAALGRGRLVPDPDPRGPIPRSPVPGNRDPPPPSPPAYSLRKSLSWRLNLSRSSAELRCPKSSGAGGSKPRGSENIVHGLRLARRAGLPSGAHGGRRLGGRRRLWRASGSRHFPGRERLLPAERSFRERPETDRAQEQGAPEEARRGGSDITAEVSGFGALSRDVGPLLSQLFVCALSKCRTLMSKTS